MWLYFFFFFTVSIAFEERQIFAASDALSLVNFFFFCFFHTRFSWALHFLLNTLKSVLFGYLLHKAPYVYICIYIHICIYLVFSENSVEKVKALMPMDFCFSSFWQKKKSLKIVLRYLYSMRFICPSNICSRSDSGLDASELKRCPQLSLSHFRSNNAQEQPSGEADSIMLTTVSFTSHLSWQNERWKCRSS